MQNFDVLPYLLLLKIFTSNLDRLFAIKREVMKKRQVRKYFVGVMPLLQFKISQKSQATAAEDLHSHVMHLYFSGVGFFPVTKGIFISNSHKFCLFKFLASLSQW